MALDISIRPLMMDEWRALRRVRLRALSLHPCYFAWTVEKAAAQPESFWHDYLKGNDKCVFGLFDGANLIGITGVFTHRDYPDGKTADFGMSFIEPDYRGQKLSRLLYQARIEWARDNSFDRIIVAHHIENEASKYANQHFGFRYISEHMHDWPDGSKAVEKVYELKLSSPNGP